MDVTLSSETPSPHECPCVLPITSSPSLSPAAPEVNGVSEPSVAKRPKGTPERIELENYRLSMQREEELEEVPEETLAEHNLSSVLDKGTDVDEGSSSSESDMEDEGEELEPPASSDLGGVPWKEAVQLHAKLKAGSDAGASRKDGEMEEEDEEDEEEDDEEEEEEEEDEEEEEESSDEGEYYPWERELQSGLWLENLKDEEDTGTFKARNLRIQQTLQPMDPMEGEKEERSDSGSLPSFLTQNTQPVSCTVPTHKSVRHEAVRAWLDSMSGGSAKNKAAALVLYHTAYMHAAEHSM
ncbi:protein-methionine sulfoxide oxidase mical3a isoform X1 [Tachysurus ichikawai]